MKKLFLLFASVVLLSGCATMSETDKLANCKYTLKSVEISEYNVNSLSFDIVIAITNLNRKDPTTLKRFEGELSMNDTPVSKINLDEVTIQPNFTHQAKTHITVPMSAFGSKLLGLVSMNSATIDYHLTGTMYFEGPLGAEIPVPIDIGRIGGYNT